MSKNLNVPQRETTANNASLQPGSFCIRFDSCGPR